MASLAGRGEYAPPPAEGGARSPGTPRRPTASDDQPDTITITITFTTTFTGSFPTPGTSGVLRPTSSKGAKTATNLLADAGTMFATWWKFKGGLITRAELQRDTRSYRDRFKIFCAWGANQDPDRRWRALGRDLLRQWDAVFLFLDVEGVEPTNNTAERGLRSGVMWRRTTQGTRSDAGTTFVQRIMTAQANCKRQGRSVLRFLTATLMAHRQGLMPPSLVPVPT